VKSKVRIPQLDILIVLIQFQYLTRKPLHVREHFFDKMYDNIRKCGFDHKSEDELIAMAIAAAGSKGNYPIRIGIVCRALDLIYNLLEHGMHDDA